MIRRLGTARAAMAVLPCCIYRSSLLLDLPGHSVEPVTLCPGSEPVGSRTAGKHHGGSRPHHPANA